MAEKNNVRAQNEKVFKDFKKKLSSIQSYAQTAEKFRRWLGTDEAYYTDARPRIVDILLTAEGTLRKEGPTQNYTELARAFIKLVCTVEPFQARFVEPELQASIRHLLETVAILQAPHPAPSGSQASAPSPPVPVHAPSFPSTAIDPSQKMRPSSSSLSAASTQAPLANTNRLSVAPTPPPAYTKESSSPLVSVTPAISPTKEKLAAVAPASTKQDSNKPISPSVPEIQSPPIVTLTANAAPPPSADSGFESASASLPPVASKPKRKKKKKGDDNVNLMQVDIQKYYGKGGTIPKSPEGTQIGNAASSTSAVAVSSPVQVTQTVLKPAVGDSPSVSVSSLPKSRPDTPMKEELKAKKPAPVDGMQSSNADVIMGIQSQSEDIEMTAATSSVPDAASGALFIEMNDEVNRVLYTLTGLAPSEVAVPETVGPDGLRSDETMPPVSHIIDHSSVPECLMDDVASLIKRREAKGNRSPPNAALQHACDAAKAERDAAVAERERLRKATQSQLHDAREKIKHLEAQHAADSQKLLARCSGAAAELSTLQANIAASSAENTQLQKQLHDSMAQLTVSSADLGRIRAEAARVHDQLEEVRRQGEQDRAEAHKDMSEAQAEIDGLRQALANTQAERMALQNARDQDIDDAERQIEERQKTAENAWCELGKLTSQLGEARDESSRLRAELARIRSETSSTVARNADLIEVLASTRKELEGEKDKRCVAQATIDELNTQLTTFWTEILRLLKMQGAKPASLATVLPNDDPSPENNVEPSSEVQTGPGPAPESDDDPCPEIQCNASPQVQTNQEPAPDPMPFLNTSIAASQTSSVPPASSEFRPVKCPRLSREHKCATQMRPYEIKMPEVSPLPPAPAGSTDWCDFYTKNSLAGLAQDQIDKGADCGVQIREVCTGCITKGRPCLYPVRRESVQRPRCLSCLNHGMQKCIIPSANSKRSYPFDKATLQGIAGYHNAAVTQGKTPGQWMGDGVSQFNPGAISPAIQPDTRDTATIVASQVPRI